VANRRRFTVALGDGVAVAVDLLTPCGRVVVEIGGDDGGAQRAPRSSSE
jgi:hypothetical protein